MAILRNILFFALLPLIMCGCGYSKIFFSKIKAKMHPTPQNLVTSSPENGYLVTGKVVGDVGTGVPVAVAAVAWWKSGNRVAGYTILPSSGPYYLFLPEGRYQLLVFADLNRNRVFEQNELVGREGDTAVLTVEKKVANRGTVPGGVVSADPAAPRTCDVPFELDVPETLASSKSAHFPTGEITGLDDERFDEDNGSLGLYEPAAYFEQVSGFFFMLEEYDPVKIPVIFVHGAGGTPKDWEFIVAGMDRTRFQPWFFFYPSGLKLETITEVFYDLFLSGTMIKSDKMVIAALSQGGLIVRSAMNRCTDPGGGAVPQLFVSFCTPYGGVESAATYGSRSPVIVPSWLDLACDSDYMKTLRQRKLLAGTKFHLFFAYGTSRIFRIGPNGDGVISLKSQLDPLAQREAERIYGFDETHSGILRNKEVLDEFNALLAEVR
jgi:hypothetical protein